MDANTGPELSSGARTAQDACATLVELARALKGWLFYQPRSLERGDLADRAWRVLRGEIERNGPLALQVRRGTFWLAGTDVPIGVGRVDDLARRLQERGVGRIVFDPELEPGALGAALDVLVADATEVVTSGGFEAVYLARSQRGISVNDAEWRAHVRPLASLVTPTPDITVPDLREGADELLVIDGDAPGEPEPLDLLDVLEPPIDAPAAPEPVDELGERLRELGECESDARYRDVARHLVFDAQRLVENGRHDDAYRVLEAFAAQAGDDAKRSFSQRESARECVTQLCQGALLGDVVRRACEDDIEATLRAIGVLREIGPAAVPRLLDEIEREPADSLRRSRLAGTLFALGEEAAPALADAIASGAPRRQHAALRLAGDSQNPRLVPSLRDALFGRSTDAAREAAHALVRIGDVSALEVLAEALESDRAALVSLAAQALAATGRALAVTPLTAALDRNLAAQQNEVARDLVRALGRLGRPEAAPALAELVARGGFFERRRLRELKVAAIHALAHLPGRVADEALARFARQGDAPVRQAADTARRRRTHDARKVRE